MKMIINLDKYPKNSIFGICYKNGIKVYKDHINLKFKKEDVELILHRHLNFDNAIVQVKKAFNI